MGRMIKLVDAWLMYGGGRAPKDPRNPTYAEKQAGAAFYRRLVSSDEVRRNLRAIRHGKKGESRIG